MTRATLWVCLLSVSCLFACKGVEEVALEDVGGLCAWGADDGGTYVEGESVELRILMVECLECGASEVTTTCSVDQEGTTLQVHATADYTIDQSVETCLTVCETVFVGCESEPLAAGTYTLEYGGESTSFEVPSAGEMATLTGGCSI